MRFQLNQLIVFDDETMTVSSVSYPSQHLKLGSIHSRCFSFLCQKKLENRSIISKKELFYEGWERHGLMSSNNSLAQTIFQLRRSLKAFDSDDILVTVPRVGFKLQQVSIQILSSTLVTHPTELLSEGVPKHRGWFHLGDLLSYKKQNGICNISTLWFGAGLGAIGAVFLLLRGAKAG